MKRSQRNRARLTGWDRLEPRSLLSVLPTAAGTESISATGTVPGNGGHIFESQFQSGAFGEVGAQEAKLFLGGPLRLDIAPPSLVNPHPPAFGVINTGNIIHSQFNSFGFSDFGAQIKSVHIHGGLTLGISDETLGPDQPEAGRPRGTPANTGDVISSQVNDSGFGNIGMQLDQTHIGGDLSVQSHQFVRPSIGGGTPTTSAGSITPAQVAPAQGHRGPANDNEGLIWHTQFNDGGFGDIGLQWRKVHVGGSVGIGFERWEVGPFVPTAASTSGASTAQQSSDTSGNATNSGHIVKSQFSDGAFGDVGMQWLKVNVGKNVGTSYNTLSIQPKINTGGPIIVNGLALGLAQFASTSETAQPLSVVPSSQSTVDSSAAAGVSAAEPAPGTSAGNSGTIYHSQVADGGFGDIGLQWRNVKVHGSVATVHNSLSVQPEVLNQGPIIVNNVHFPSAVATFPPPHVGTERALPAFPPVIHQDGDPVTDPLPTPTRPFQNTLTHNFATNSGNITNSQVEDGGFGDFGLQWLNVGVNKNVGLVHNSLSVHPEQGGIAGINVSNVFFGDPLPSNFNPDLSTGRLVTPPNQVAIANQLRAEAAARGDGHIDHVNDKLLDHMQLISEYNAPIILQWEAQTRHHGLLIVNNIIIFKFGPDTGPVTITDVRMPGLPPINIFIPHPVANTDSTLTAAQDQPAPTGANHATNSGIVWHNQFSGGGFGDIGMQWRSVHIHGNVSVVHNTLSVDVANLNNDTVPNGPINIQNVTFNSGALADVQHPFVRKIVAPPPFFSRLPFIRPDRSKPLPVEPDDHATNSGILIGGQFSARGNGHIFLQWSHVKMGGPVTVMDNVLAIDTRSHSSGPINIAHVIYA